MQINQTSFTYTSKFRKTDQIGLCFGNPKFCEKSNCTLTEPVNILFDQKMLTTNFQLHSRKRGSDYWKFNSELVIDTTDCQKIKYLLSNVKL